MTGWCYGSTMVFMTNTTKCDLIICDKEATLTTGFHSWCDRHSYTHLREMDIEAVRDPGTQEAIADRHDIGDHSHCVRWQTCIAAEYEALETGYRAGEVTRYDYFQQVNELDAAIRSLTTPEPRWATHGTAR